MSQQEQEEVVSVTFFDTPKHVLKVNTYDYYDYGDKKVHLSQIFIIGQNWGQFMNRLFRNIL